MTTFIASLAVVALAMAGLGVGVILRKRGLKGHCNGRACAQLAAPPGTEPKDPDLAISGCQRTLHLPGQ